MWKRAQRFFATSLIAGLIVLLPIVATVYVVTAILRFSDTFLFKFLPPEARPDALLGFNLPGLGILMTVGIVLLAGVGARFYFGRKALELMDKLLSSVPLLRGIYSTIRQLIEAVLSSRDKSFRKVVAIEYPRKGLYTLAFVTGSGNPMVGRHAGEKLQYVFVPTTPNPTSGFLLLVPQAEIIDVDLKVDEAFRLVVSGGILTEKGRSIQAGAPAGAPA